MARFVGSVGRPPGTLSANCTFSTIELYPPPPCMYTTRVHILYARAMIERLLGKRARLSLRNREAKLFSRLSYTNCIFTEKISDSNQCSSLIDAMIASKKRYIRVNRAIKSGNLFQSSVTAVTEDWKRCRANLNVIWMFLRYWKEYATNLSLYHYFPDYFVLLFLC